MITQTDSRSLVIEIEKLEQGHRSLLGSQDRWNHWLPQLTALELLDATLDVCCTQKLTYEQNLRVVWVHMKPSTKKMNICNCLIFSYHRDNTAENSKTAVFSLQWLPPCQIGV